MRRRLTPRLLWLGLGLLALLLPFHQLLYSDRALFFRDLSRDVLVQKSIWAAAVRAGEGIPLWNRFALGGTPFYSMIVGSPQNPLNVFFLFFPQSEAPRALAWYLWMHYALFAAGTAMLLRSFRIQWSLAVIMAATAALSGYMLSAHSLAHLVAASVAVPWYFFFERRYFLTRGLRFLFLSSLMIAWPVYAGDPQFSYVLALGSAFGFLRRGLWGPWLSLGVLAFLASAAQLLPTSFEILQSERLSITTSELLQFSFHPSRLAEIFFPFFFGNRYGEESFWGAELVNFHYKHPFIFSVYPGILCLIALPLLPAVLARKRWRRRDMWLLLSVIGGFCLSMGAFFPLPVYEYLSRWVPFFGLFRYPERLLFWPLFALWLLCTLSLWRGLRLPRLFLGKGYIFSSLALLACAFLVWQLAPLPAPARVAVLTTILKVGLIFTVIQALCRWKMHAFLPLAAFVALSCELYADQSRLVWFQSKHMADGQRYTLVRGIQASIAARSGEIERGAAFRFSAGMFSGFEFNPGRMDHTVATTFNLFENLAPNTAGLFGIEDTAGYFSFIPARRVQFWNAVVVLDALGGRDLRFFHDLTGAYYVPRRDAYDQQIRLEVNETALPYLYVPEKIFFEETFEGSLKALRAEGFRPNLDAVLAGHAGPPVQQRGERGNFHVLRRDGRAIEVEYLPGPGSEERFLVLGESFHEGWKAWAGEERLPLWTANGWSMITKLRGAEQGKAIRILFRFEPPWLKLGIALTLIWLLLAAAAGLVRGLRHFSQKQNRLRGHVLDPE